MVTKVVAIPNAFAEYSAQLKPGSRVFLAYELSELELAQHGQRRAR
jgi:hypothetical protein